MAHPAPSEVDRRAALIALTKRLRNDLVRLGAERAEVNRWPLERLIIERRRILDELMQPARGARCRD